MSKFKSIPAMVLAAVLMGGFVTGCANQDEVARLQQQLEQAKKDAEEARREAANARARAEEAERASERAKGKFGRGLHKK